MPIKSRLAFGAYFTKVFTAFLTIAGIYIVVMVADNGKFSVFQKIYPAVILILFWLFMVFAEIKRKCVSITITDIGITQTQLGFITKTYAYADIDGYQLCYIQNKAWEEIYIIFDKKRVITISPRHLKNYEELEDAISAKIPSLVSIIHNPIDDFKNIFK